MNPFLWPRWAQGVALLVAAVAAFLIWDWFDDRAAVNADRANSNADFREKQIEGEREAGKTKGARDRAEDDEQEDLEDDVDEADRSGDSAGDAFWSDVFG